MEYYGGDYCKINLKLQLLHVAANLVEPMTLAENFRHYKMSNLKKF